MIKMIVVILSKIIVNINSSQGFISSFILYTTIIFNIPLKLSILTV